MWPFSWWRRFWRRIELLGDSGVSIDLEDLKELAEKNPTKIYVNRYLLRMARQGLSHQALRQSDSLPVVAHYTLPELPSFESVANRLKIMANLDPVIYQHPKEGRIEFDICGSNAVLHLRFDDTAPDRSVYLRLEWLDEPPPPTKLG